ncbi:hypothetical protein SLE2022_334350 [Rubroshorea leprosula]
MSSPDSKPGDSDSQSLDPKTPESVSDSSADTTENRDANQQITESTEKEREGEEDEEEGECGFCLFMKGGGCKDAFVAWENCINDAKDEDYVEKCAGVTMALKECMTAHADYYEPILRVEKAAEEEALRELEKEKEKEAAESEQKTGSNDSEKNVASKDLKQE